MHELAAPPELLAVWRTFDGFPMETLSKARVYAREGPRQRSVAELEADRARYGASGNCFDLALWLRHRLRAAGFVAEVISDDIGDRDAHVAVLAQTGAGRRYLCDLGDMWLQPIAVDAPVLEPVPWFFPAARVTLRCDGPRRVVTMHRPGGKRAAQPEGRTIGSRRSTRTTRPRPTPRPTTATTRPCWPKLRTRSNG